MRETHHLACWAGRGYDFIPAHTALIVIDMQKDFVAPGGMAEGQGEDLSLVREIIPRLQDLVSAARDAGVEVIHTREGFAADLSDLPAVRHDRGSVGTPGPLGRFLIRGEPGQDFIDELRPAASELVIDKPGYGAFFRSNLEERLKRTGITHLLLGGVTTQCCVQSTLREAVDRGFACLLLQDCCAAFDPQLHEATLATIQGEDHLFGWIADSPELIAALARPSPSEPSP